MPRIAEQHARDTVSGMILRQMVNEDICLADGRAMRICLNAAKDIMSYLATHHDSVCWPIVADCPIGSPSDFTTPSTTKP